MTDASCSNILNIDDLNDDCLIHIFTFLRIPDRLRIEKVCKRWQSLALVSWLKVRRLELDTDLHLKDIFCIRDIADCDASDLKKVLELCGPNLTCIAIEHDCIESNETILSSIHTLCPKIKDIEIGPHCELAKVKNIVCNFTELASVHLRFIDCGNGDFLAELFRKNQKLQSLTLEYCSFSTECFSHLNHESIIELNLNENYIDSIELLVNVRRFLFKFKTQ